MATLRRVGILTGGGDCPGLNAAIRGVVARLHARGGIEAVGIRNGWQGLLEDDVVPLDRDDVRGLLTRGGTILGTSRFDPYVHGDGLASIRGVVERHEIDAVVVIGGDGTLRSALRLWHEGLPVVGVPKTIDNDIAGTDVTFGFDTAVHIATDAIDRLTTTAEAHHRVMLVEVMGRTKGWIALHAGIAGGADVILVPEEPYDLEEVAARIRERRERGRNYSMVVVAEGVDPPPGVTVSTAVDVHGFERLGGVSFAIARRLEEATGIETRVTILGHLQRGGTPTARDRVLATRFGAAAADLVVEGTFGVLAAARGEGMVPVPLEDACREIRGVDLDLVALARDVGHS